MALLPSMLGRNWVAAVACTGLFAASYNLYSCSSSNKTQTSINVSAKVKVYNAVFSPVVPQTRSIILDKKPTTVRFNIGLPDKLSAVDSDNWTVNPKLLSSAENIPLVVTMICPFCEKFRFQTKAITYLGKEGASTDARFEFTPLRALIDDPAGKGRIAFQITRDGVQCDYVVANVTVVKAAKEIIDGNKEPERPVALREALMNGASWSHGVDLVIKVRSNGTKIQVQLEPGNAQVGQILGGKHIDTDGDFKWFDTGMLAADVRQYNAGFYSDLSATINNDSKLKELLSGSSSAVQRSPNDILLEAEDEQLLLNPIVGAGGQIYRALFVTGADPSLRVMLDNFRLYMPDHPPRVKIESAGIYLPWQILLPSGSSDSDEIWGFRYELSINPTGLILPGPFQGPLSYKSGPLIFGQYHSSDPGDIVMSLGSSEIQLLQSDWKIPGIIVADTRNSFLKNIVESRKNLQMIVTFTHGISGTVIHSDGSVSESLEGPKLKFGNDDFVPARELNKELGRISVTEESMFENSPLVLLNGCETGTAGFYATTNMDFGGTFLRMGSRGVIVTEAPVWTYFGYNFGLSLLKDLKSGSNVPAALRNTRRDYLQKMHNPLGLLYTYYGGPDVTVQFAKGNGVAEN